MRGVLVPILVAGFVAAGALQVWAGPIAITGSTADPRFLAQTSTNSNLGSESAICTAFGLSAGCLGGSSQLLYKADTANRPPSATPASEAGSLLGSYDTLFSPATGDFSGGVVSYVGGAYASCPGCFLIVKDGRHDPAQYLFTLNAVGLQPAWDGTSSISLSGFWDGRGGEIFQRGDLGDTDSSARRRRDARSAGRCTGWSRRAAPEVPPVAGSPVPEQRERAGAIRPFCFAQAKRRSAGSQ